MCVDTNYLFGQVSVEGDALDDTLQRPLSHDSQIVVSSPQHSNDTAVFD